MKKETSLLIWGWTSRGLISHDEMAKSRGLSVEELDKQLAEGKNREKKFNLFELPDLEPPTLMEHVHKPVPGSFTHVWQVQAPCVLPCDLFPTGSPVPVALTTKWVCTCLSCCVMQAYSGIRAGQCQGHLASAPQAPAAHVGDAVCQVPQDHEVL